MDERSGNKSDSDSDDLSSRHTAIVENGYHQPVETPYVENAVEELGQVRHCPHIVLCLVYVRRRFCLRFCVSGCLSLFL